MPGRAKGPLIAGQDQKGRFAKGNKLGPGRKVGSRLPPPVFDGKISTAQAGRFRDILFAMVDDLGGHDAISTGQYQLARRCAQISVMCEDMERKAAEGEPFDVTGYNQLTGQLSRALRTLGIKRTLREAAPSLKDYLNARTLERQANGTFKAEDKDDTGISDTGNGNGNGAFTVAPK
jgi:hypothetical protein